MSSDLITRLRALTPAVDEKVIAVVEAASQLVGSKRGNPGATASGYAGAWHALDAALFGLAEALQHSDDCACSGCDDEDPFYDWGASG